MDSFSVYKSSILSSIVLMEARIGSSESIEARVACTFRILVMSS